MQETTYKRLTGIGQVLVLSMIFICVTDCAVAQLISQPDSLIVQHQVLFRPQPATAKSFILPAALITTGTLGISGEFVISNPEIKEERDESFRTFRTSVDNYLQFAPIAAGYGMLINSKDHSFWIYTEKVLATEVIVTATVQATKRITNVKRPDGSPYSFPSGHTAQAFASAVLFSDEFAQHKLWLAVSAYTSAAAVGVFRVLNNRHWASDVIAGAGFGILSAKVSELIIDSYNKKHHSSHTYIYQF